MNDYDRELLERLVAALEKLEPHLEKIANPPVFIGGGGASAVYGYTCTKCWQWVPSGTAHTCFGGGGNMTYCNRCGTYYTGTSHVCGGGITYTTAPDGS